MTGRRIARVLVDSPLPQLDRLFDYAIPDQYAAEAVPGVRVRVPLRSAGRVVDGYLIELGEQEEDRPLSEIDAVVSPIEVLPARLYGLARRVADRAAGSAGDILRLAIPRRMVRAEKAWIAAGAPEAPVVSDEAAIWSAEVLSGFPGLLDATRAGERIAVDAVPQLTRTIAGATIGGWAELIAAAAVAALASGHSAIIAVPDHRDLDQVESALDGRAPEGAVVRDDAARTAQERYSAYLRVLAPEPCIVIGKRSAVYAPAHELALIVIWDDGDPLLAEPLAPGVHARDAALVRQEHEGCALLFAGHTRTTDVERLVSLGWVREISAPRRVKPKVVLSAIREGESRGTRVPSTAFAAARAATALGPVLVQVSRPGFAPTLVCADCRKPARCLACGGPLHVARAGAVPSCGWCGRVASSWKCPHCEGTKFRLASSGSERTAEELGRAFPGIRVIVADGEHPVLRVDDRPALVVATRGAEPIADGGYRAIILLDGDRMLLSEDLRVGESCLRWWSNAAALAAPGAPVHLVGVDGPVAVALASWTQAAYARDELADRGPLRMPPAVRVAVLDGTPRAVAEALKAVREAVPTLPPEAVLGPVHRDTEPARGLRSRGRVETQGAPIDRALVRFDYAHGHTVTETLRASVVTEALRSRRPAKGRPPAPRNTLRVRVDVPDPEL